MRGTLSYRIAGPTALLLALVLSAPASAGRLSPHLKGLSVVAGGEGQVEVIITYRTHPGPDHKARLHGRGALGSRELRLVRGMSALVPVSSLQDLADDPDVESVVVDERLSAASDVAIPAVGGFLAREALGVDGRGVRVAIIDSGVAPVEGLGATRERPLGRLVASHDVIDPNRKTPVDPYGHGTHVAGIIAGALHWVHESGSRTLYGGMAPEAEIVSVRVLDRNGEGRASDVIAGLDWVVERAEALDIRVVNLSLGHPVREAAANDPLVLAVERAIDAGLVVVVSAGNLGRMDNPLGTITSPGNAPGALTVGALADQGTIARGDDLIATYSSLGPTLFDGFVKPDLLAPGDGIVSLLSPHSLLDRSFPDNRVGASSRGASSPEMFRMSGTSMAAAVASGAAALLLSADPSLSPDSVKAHLMRSAEKRVESLFARGAGSLDVMAALDEVDAARMAYSPVVSSDGAHVRMTDLEDWNVDWGAEDLYGPQVHWDLDLAWEMLQPLQDDGDEGFVWQLPTREEQQRRLIIWDRAHTPSPESVVWQVRSNSVVWQGKAAAESVVWQGKAAAESVVWQDKATAESVVWQQDAKLKGESVVWQGDSKMQAESVVWQGDAMLSAESVVWQINASAHEILIHGDSGN